MKVRKIESSHNINLKRLIKESDGYYVFEGKKLVDDIVARGTYLEVIMTDMNSEITYDLRNLNSRELWLVSRAVLKKFSSLKDPTDIIAVADLVHEPVDFSLKKPVLSLDNIQDPGNMGTLFRCAAAFGIKDLALSGNCSNLHNRKFIRAAQDSIFSLRVTRFKNLNSLIRKGKDSGYNIYLTSPKNTGQTIGIDKIESPSIIVIGSEGKGLEETFLKTFKSVVIGQSEDVESLNAGVSGCIIMYELGKRLSLYEDNR